MKTNRVITVIYNLHLRKQINFSQVYLVESTLLVRKLPTGKINRILLDMLQTNRAVRYLPLLLILLQHIFLRMSALISFDITKDPDLIMTFNCCSSAYYSFWCFHIIYLIKMSNSVQCYFLTFGTDDMNGFYYMMFHRSRQYLSKSGTRGNHGMVQTF